MFPVEVTESLVYDVTSSTTHFYSCDREEIYGAYVTAWLWIWYSFVIPLAAMGSSEQHGKKPKCEVVLAGFAGLLGIFASSFTLHTYISSKRSDMELVFLRTSLALSCISE